VAIFAMPSDNNIPNNPEIAVSTWDNVDMWHQSGWDPEWWNWEQVDTWDLATSKNHNINTWWAKTTDIQVFPDPWEEGGDDIIEDPNNEDPNSEDPNNENPNNEDSILPYTWDITEDPNSEDPNNENPNNEISLEEAQLKISSFKSQGEAYYKQW
jgi:hypothetical protein